MSVISGKYSITTLGTQTLLNNDNAFVSLESLKTIYVGVTGSGSVDVKIKYLGNTAAVPEATIAGGSGTAIIDIQNATEIAFTETAGSAVVVTFSGE